MGNRSGISEPITHYHYPLPGSQIYIFPQLSERAMYHHAQTAFVVSLGTLAIGILRPKCLKNPRAFRSGSVNQSFYLMELSGLEPLTPTMPL
jgi:hypothetical protein